MVERSMYWPGGFYDYYGSHGSVGATHTSTDWLMPEGEEGGFQLYLALRIAAYFDVAVEVVFFMKPFKRLGD